MLTTTSLSTVAFPSGCQEIFFFLIFPSKSWNATKNKNENYVNGFPTAEVNKKVEAASEWSNWLVLYNLLLLLNVGQFSYWAVQRWNTLGNTLIHQLMVTEVGLTFNIWGGWRWSGGGSSESIAGKARVKIFYYHFEKNWHLSFCNIPCNDLTFVGVFSRRNNRVSHLF